MKHLMYDTALAVVLVLSASAWAQGQSTPPATAAPIIKLPEPSEPSQAPVAKPATATPQTATAATPRPKRHVKRARRYAREYPYYEENYYREDYYRGRTSPDDYMADELNRRQVLGGWYGGGVQNPYAPYAPPAPYAPYPAPQTYYPWGY
jgi:hypothetical protein